jgi:hypothetical protein
MGSLHMRSIDVVFTRAMISEQTRCSYTGARGYLAIFGLECRYSGLKLRCKKRSAVTEQVCSWTHIDLSVVQVETRIRHEGPDVDLWRCNGSQSYSSSIDCISVAVGHRQFFVADIPNICPGQLVERLIRFDRDLTGYSYLPSSTWARIHPIQSIQLGVSHWTDGCCKSKMSLQGNGIGK